MARTLARSVTMAALASTMLALPQTASADPDGAECGIWLCLPVGFAFPECGESFEAMLDRLARLKPPLPMLNSCMVDVPDAPRSQGNFTHIESNEPYCQEGYTLLEGEDLVRRESDVFRDDEIGRNGNATCYPNNGIGDPVEPTYGTRHTVQVEIDGVRYDPYTFNTP